jgi:hypothetical protein
VVWCGSCGFGLSCAFVLGAEDGGEDLLGIEDVDGVGADESLEAIEVDGFGGGGVQCCFSQLAGEAAMRA